MNGYINYIIELLETELNDKEFSIIKFKNFNDPEIYLRISNYFSDKMEKLNITFISKLAEEKYLFWKNLNEYNEILQELRLKKYIEEDGHLTKWRNYFLDNNIYKGIVFLYGTEAVEDQGGLEDFYTISPETISDSLKDNYSKLLGLSNENFKNRNSESISNIYREIFKFSQKDLFKLSCFFDGCKRIEKEDELVRHIFRTLYDVWELPNIWDPYITIGDKKLKEKGIGIIKDGNKLVRRIGYDNIPSKNKLTKYKKNIEKIKEENQKEISREKKYLFPGYESFDEFSNDVLNYLNGKNILNVKDKIFKCDFAYVQKIIKGKVVSIDDGGVSPVRKTIRISGEPIVVFFKSILKTIDRLTDEDIKDIRKIEIRFDKVSFSDINTKDELIERWNNLSRFIGNFDNLLKNKLYLNDETEIEFKVNAKGIEKESIFKNDMFGEMYNEKILSGSSALTQNSKIDFRCQILDKTNRRIDFEEYRWIFSNDDDWINTMEILNNDFFNKCITEKKEFLPYIYSEKVDALVSSTNKTDFYNTIMECDFTIENFIDESVRESKLGVPIRKFSEKFTMLLRKILKEGLFSIINEKEYLEFNDSYKNLLKKSQQFLEVEEDKGLVYELNKTLMFLNDKNFGSSNIVGAVVPFYNPVMLEKIIARYTFLRDGFIELLDAKLKDRNDINWDDELDRIDQLSKINFSHCLLLSEKNNSYAKCKKTFGFYSIYGDKSNKKVHKRSIEYSSYLSDESISNETNPTDRFMTKVLNKYVDTYPSKNDEFTVAFFDPDNFQDIVNSLKGLVKKMKNVNIESFNFNLYIFTNDYLLEGKEYLKYWINSKIKEKDNIRIKIYMTYFDFECKNIKSEFLDKVPNLDIAFFTKVMEEDGIEEIQTESELIDEQKITEKKYPIVYLPYITSELKKRKMIINQMQFELEHLHMNFILYAKNSNIVKSTYNIIMKRKLRENFEEIIKESHNKANWVVIIDENIDVDLIDMTNDSVNIIGFSTGEGYFGEMNTTISTNSTYKNDLREFLMKRLKDRFYKWEIVDIEESVNKIISSLGKLDGAEILRAINPNDKSINEFLAFILTSKLLKVEEFDKKYLIRKLISLDSYSSLFSEKIACSSNERPDHLLIEIPMKQEDDELEIRLSIIECKMGSKVGNDRISKAKNQLLNGEKIIKNIWNPNSEKIKKRFYFNQLFRLLAISRKNECNMEYKDMINQEIKKVNEGKFTLKIQKLILAFNINEFTNDEIIDSIQQEIGIFEFNHSAIKKLFLGKDVNFELSSYNLFEEISRDVDGDIMTNQNEENIEDNKNIKSIDAQDNESIIYPNNGESNEEIVPIASDPPITRRMIEQKVLNIFKKRIDKNLDQEELKDIKGKFRVMVKEFEVRGIKIYMNSVLIGPDIARGSFELGTGVSIKAIEKYRKDMKLWLSVNSEPYIFIDNGEVKIDIVRKYRKTIGLKYALEKIDLSKYGDYQEKCLALLGLDITGKPYLVDFSDSNTPHLLIAGQTGSGKSVLLASILTSMKVFYSPKDIEFYLVDPKMVELTVFEDSPYTTESVVEVDDALNLLKLLEEKMDERYRLFRKLKVKDISSYNNTITSDEKMKRIIMVFDEYASMIESGNESKKSMEKSIKHLSQKARAAGIHIIICTQSPKAEILTTTIRNNLAARVGLRVTDSTASNLILDNSGAETLLGKGDMWFKTPRFSQMIRLKSPFIENDEIGEIIKLRRSEYGV